MLDVGSVCEKILYAGYRFCQHTAYEKILFMRKYCMLDVGSVCEKILYVDRTYIIESYINTLRQTLA